METYANPVSPVRAGPGWHRQREIDCARSILSRRRAVLAVIVLLLGDGRNYGILESDLIARAGVRECGRSAIRLIHLGFGRVINLATRGVGHLVVGGAAGKQKKTHPD